jgi:hypothetical protein
VQRERYDEALEQLRKADRENPNDALMNLWLGVALEGTDQPYEAMAAWRAAYGNPRWEPVADYLKGLCWWKLGRTNDATNYLKDALTNVTDGSRVEFKPAKTALEQVASGQPAPPVGQWAEISTLMERTDEALGGGAAKAQGKPGKADARPNPVQPVAAPVTAQPANGSVRPVSGKWVGVRTSGGYQGGKILFTVSADGKRVEDVVFIGNWYNREDRRTETVTTGPDGAFSIAGGRFGETRTNAKTHFGWEFDGQLLNARSAKGTFRGYAYGIYSTGTIQWEAHPAK